MAMREPQEGDVPETGDICSITEGPGAGKRGSVVRERGEGAEKEWCVRCGFKEIWTKSVTIIQKKEKPKRSSVAGIADMGEGAEVQIMSGEHAGTFGTVAAVSGSGDSMRWRVKVETSDNLFAVWVDKVAPAVGRRSLKGNPADAEALKAAIGDGEIVEGSFVEILDGSAAGSFGTINKVAGEPFARRYKVQVEGKDGTTWAEKVKLADKDAPREASTAGKKDGAHYATLRPADYKNVPWSQVKGCHAASGGSGGVLLVDLGEECVVLKPPGATSTNELLADRIADCCGVRVAKTRIVKHGQEEHEQLVQGITATLTKEDVAEMKIAGVWVLAEGKVHGSGLIAYGVVEFVQGVACMGVEAQKILVAPAPELLIGLGRLCALDVLINNMDRVPLPVWQNDGNMGNVMIAGGSAIVGIDQQVNAIRQGGYRDTYVRKVTELIDEVAPAGDPTDIVTALTAVMHTNVGLTLERAEADKVVQGLREGFQSIATVARDGSLEKCLEGAAAECAAEFVIPGSQSNHFRAPAYDEKAVADMIAFVAAVGAAVAEKSGVLGAS